MDVLQLRKTFREIEDDVRRAERHACVTAVLAEARSYRERAADLRTQSEPEMAREMDAIEAALVNLANVMGEQK